MNKKISIGVCISLIAIACTVTFVITWTVSLNTFNSKLPGTFQRDKIMQLLQEMDAFVQSNALNEVDDEQVAKSVFLGYMTGTGDKNAAYLTAEEYTRLTEEEKGTFVTTGIRAEEEASGYLRVAEVYADSDAAIHGIAVGDLIVAIEGSNVLSIETETAIKMLDGGENMKIALTIRSDGEDKTYDLIRQSIDISSIESDIVNDIGIIRISSFNALTAEQFTAALTAFGERETSTGKKGEIGALLIDLRGNKSDYFAPISDIANNFAGAGTLAYIKQRGGVQKDFISTNDTNHSRYSDIPIVILTNGDTSGAGEVLAAVLSEYSQAQIVGTKTAGNFYEKQTHPLTDGSAVRVTVAKIVLANGSDYTDAGITPLHEVEMEFPVNYTFADLKGIEQAAILDPQIRKAFEILQTATNN